jgi:hypothetical protein
MAPDFKSSNVGFVQSTCVGWAAKPLAKVLTALIFQRLTSKRLQTVCRWHTEHSFLAPVKEYGRTTWLGVGGSRTIRTDRVGLTRR